MCNNWLKSLDSQIATNTNKIAQSNLRIGRVATMSHSLYNTLQRRPLPPKFAPLTIGDLAGPQYNNAWFLETTRPIGNPVHHPKRHLDRIGRFSTIYTLITNG